MDYDDRLRNIEETASFESKSAESWNPVSAPRHGFNPHPRRPFGMQAARDQSVRNDSKISEENR
jgi:hypothetical protein